MDLGIDIEFVKIFRFDESFICFFNVVYLNGIYGKYFIKNFKKKFKLMWI